MCGAVESLYRRPDYSLTDYPPIMYRYLKRFKNLSKAFASGDFRPLANIEQQDGPSGPWQKTPLYAKLEDTSVALAKLYSQNEHVPKPKSQIYAYQSNNAAPGSKVYSEFFNAADKTKIPRPESSPQKKNINGNRSGEKVRSLYC